MSLCGNFALVRNILQYHKCRYPDRAKSTKSYNGDGSGSGKNGTLQGASGLNNKSLKKYRYLPMVCITKWYRREEMHTSFIRGFFLLKCGFLKREGAVTLNISFGKTRRKSKNDT